MEWFQASTQLKFQNKNFTFSWCTSVLCSLRSIEFIAGNIKFENFPISRLFDDLQTKIQYNIFMKVSLNKLFLIGSVDHRKIVALFCKLRCCKYYKIHQQHVCFFWKKERPHPMPILCDKDLVNIVINLYKIGATLTPLCRQYLH